MLGSRLELLKHSWVGVSAAGSVLYKTRRGLRAAVLLLPGSSDWSILTLCAHRVKYIAIDSNSSGMAQSPVTSSFQLSQFRVSSFIQEAYKKLV